MAHEIEDNKAFFNAVPAWHGLGTVLKGAPTIEEAWKIAYPHELFKLPLQAVIPDDGATMPLKRYQAVMRDDGKEIGVVGKDYELTQPWESFDFFRPYLDSGLVELEAGGSLRDGSRMWGLAKIKGADAEVVKGDPVRGYLLTYTSFDGSLSHGIQQTGIRVVCANTLAMAMGSAGEKSVTNARFKHTKNIRDRIADVQAEVMEAIKGFNDSVEAYRFIAKKKVTDPQLRAYVRNVIELDAKRDEEGNVSDRTEAKIDEVTALIFDQRGLDLIPAVRGTMWQGYNAVTQYLTHDYGRTPDSRLNAQWFGESARVNRIALEMAVRA